MSAHENISQHTITYTIKHDKASRNNAYPQYNLHKSNVCKLVNLPISFGIAKRGFSSLVQSYQKRNECASSLQSTHHQIYNQK